MAENIEIRNSTAEFLIFMLEGKEDGIQVMYKDEAIWAKRIDKFINLFDGPILQDSGKVSAEYAKEFAEAEFEKYRIIQDRLFQSDFDRFEDNSFPPLDME